MNRTEAQFCLDEAERLQTLAEQCSDDKVRNHLREMARHWTERAKFKQTHVAAPEKRA